MSFLTDKLDNEESEMNAMLKELIAALKSIFEENDETPMVPSSSG